MKKNLGRKIRLMTLMATGSLLGATLPKGEDLNVKSVTAYVPDENRLDISKTSYQVDKYFEKTKDGEIVRLVYGFPSPEDFRSGHSFVLATDEQASEYQSSVMEKLRKEKGDFR